MSKRFGRNQRRRLRQQVEQATEALAMADGLMRKMRRDRDELRGVIDDVEEALGPNFIGLPPQELVFQARHLGPERTFRTTVPGDQVVTMAIMDIDSSEKSDGYIHLRVRLDGKSVVYALSRPALLHSPARFIAQKMAMEMAPVLLQNIRKAGGR